MKFKDYIFSGFGVFSNIIQLLLPLEDEHEYINSLSDNITIYYTIIGERWIFQDICYKKVYIGIFQMTSFMYICCQPFSR